MNLDSMGLGHLLPGQSCFHWRVNGDDDTRVPMSVEFLDKSERKRVIASAYYRHKSRGISLDEAKKQILSEKYARGKK